MHHIPITIEPRDDVPKVSSPMMGRDFYEWPRAGSDDVPKVPPSMMDRDFYEWPRAGSAPRETFEPEFEVDHPKLNRMNRDFDDYFEHQTPRRRAWSGDRVHQQPEKSFPVVVEKHPQTSASPVPSSAPKETGGKSKRKESSPPRPHISKVFVNSEEEPPMEEPKEDEKTTLLLEKIKPIEQELEKWTQKVEEYSGDRKCKEYRFLDEMLTRCMLQLDNIETEGIEEVRLARKSAINNVQKYITRLETKANENAVAKQSEQSAAVEQVTEDNTMEHLDGTAIHKQLENEVSMEPTATEVVETQPAAESQPQPETIEMDQTKDSFTVEKAKDIAEIPPEQTFDVPKEEKPEEMEVDEKQVSEVKLDINQPEPTSQVVPTPTKRSEITIQLEAAPQSEEAPSSLQNSEKH